MTPTLRAGAMASTAATNDVGLLLEEALNMGLAYVPLEGGRRYFWSAKEHDLSLLGR